MAAPTSRRASANLFAYISRPPHRHITCRAATQRLAQTPQQQRQPWRSITTTRTHHAEASASSASSASIPTSSTAAVAPTPSTSPAPKQPPHNLSPAPASVLETLSPLPEIQSTSSLTDQLSNPPPLLSENERQVDWTRSYHGLSAAPFSETQAAILMSPTKPEDIEIKPDGIVYLPEIKYRRILNQAFGPGGWGLVPRGETIVTERLVTREYGLVAGGRLVSIARGEMTYFDPTGIPTATEGCKSNALMRCCKDLGIASELWDPRFIRKYLAEFGKEVVVEHVTTKKRKRHWMRRDDELRYPFKEVSMGVSGAATAQGSGGPGVGAGGGANGGFRRSAGGRG